MRIALLTVFLALPALAAKQPPVRAVDRVDLSRYLGNWYEIASYPQWFQRGCTGTTAAYSLRPDKQIEVVNRCRLESLAGKEKLAKGRARVVDSATNAKLEVTFFWPFWGDYWILDLDPEYRWAVVGDPTREYLWVLSREPKMESVLFDAIVERARGQGFDPKRLVRTLQAEAP